MCGASILGTIEIVRASAARPLVELVHWRYLAAESADDASGAGAFLDSDDVALRLYTECVGDVGRAGQRGCRGRSRARLGAPAGSDLQPRE